MVDFELTRQPDDRWLSDGHSQQRTGKGRLDHSPASVAGRHQLREAIDSDLEELDAARAFGSTSEMIFWIGCLAVITYACASLYFAFAVMQDRAAGEMATIAQRGIPSAVHAAASGGAPVADASPAGREPLEELKEGPASSVSPPEPTATLMPGAADPAATVRAGSGQMFQDRTATGQICPYCPEMVVVPAGTFRLGAGNGEAWSGDWQKERERPQIKITIANPIAVGRYAVSFDEWETCVGDGGCAVRPSDNGWGRANRPVINITWAEANSYAAWLSRRTGQSYRLLSEAEREYVARAGTTSPYWFGTLPFPKSANYLWEQTLPVNSMVPNPWGLFHVHGNVSEWTADCWNDSHAGHPGDSAPRQTGNCNRRVVKGGSWFNEPSLLRSAWRGSLGGDSRYRTVGFRVARAIGDGASN